MVTRIRCDFLVVGLGISGLTASIELAEKGYKVVAIDMDAEPGGIHRLIPERFREYFDVNLVNELIRELSRSDVEVLLETTFIGSSGGEKVLTSPEGVYRVHSPYLLLSTGSRSITPAELRWTGYFPAGILGLRSALRLLSLKGVVAGWSTIVYGGGLLPEIFSIMLAEQGVDTTLLLPPSDTLHIDEKKLDSKGVRVERGAIKAVYGKSRVEHLTTQEGEKKEADSIIIGIREPDTLPIKFKSVDRRSNGPAIYPNFATHDDSSVYVVGSAAAVFDDPNILMEMSRELSELFDDEPKYTINIALGEAIKYIVPNSISRSNNKLFLKTSGYPDTIHIDGKRIECTQADEHVIDISEMEPSNKESIVIW